MIKFRNFLLLAGAGLCCTGVAHMVGTAAVRVCGSLCNAVLNIVEIVYNSEK